MPNGVFHSYNDYLSRDEMTGHATNGQCDSHNEFKYSCYQELDFALLSVKKKKKCQGEIAFSGMFTCVE